MTRVFARMEEYVAFMTGLPFPHGSILCSSYVPSAFFPKDTISYYFERMDPTPGSRQIVEQLWRYRKVLVKALQSGAATLCLEVEALQKICGGGIVHDAVPKFEISFALRAKALAAIKEVVEIRPESVVLARSSLPFTCHIRPPCGVLLDVTRNVSAQHVQGLWIEDPAVFRQFVSEYERHRATWMQSARRPELAAELGRAVAALSEGESFGWAL